MLKGMWDKRTSMERIPGLLVQSDPGRKEMAYFMDLTKEWLLRGLLKR